MPLDRVVVSHWHFQSPRLGISYSGLECPVLECSAPWAALEPFQILGVSRRGLRTLRLPLVEPGKDQNARGVLGRT